MLFGIGQIGCSPNQLAQNSPDGTSCVEKINSANQIFNSKLKALANEFNTNLPDARVIFVDSYGIFQDVISSPAQYGKYEGKFKNPSFIQLENTTVLFCGISTLFDLLPLVDSVQINKKAITCQLSNEVIRSRLVT